MGQVRLTSEAVDGFLLDASDDGVRAVLWTHDVHTESVVDVVLSLHGRGYARRARVRWSRQYREGSVVGLELLSDERRSDRDDLGEEITAIEPIPLVPVGDPRSRDVVVTALVRVGLAR
jgi:hypothetical protein